MFRWRYSGQMICDINSRKPERDWDCDPWPILMGIKQTNKQQQRNNLKDSNGPEFLEPNRMNWMRHRYFFFSSKFHDLFQATKVQFTSLGVIY